MKGYRVKTQSDQECPKWVRIWNQQGYGNFAGVLWQSVCWQKCQAQGTTLL